MALRKFIASVKEMGEVREINGANWDLEIGAITYLTANRPNPPALLFDKIQGYKPGFRLLSLPTSTHDRISLMLGLPLGSTGLELVKHLKSKLNEAVDLVPPVEVREGPVMQNVHLGDEVDLFEFPAPKWQALDGGRYIGTGDTVIMRDPDEGWINVSAHRIEIHDKATATIFVESGRHADIIRKKYWAKGQSCPVAVTLGGDPLYVSVAGTRIPWGMSEYDYMGWWRKKPVDVIKGPITGLPIPADAEIALEGEIVPPEVDSRMEGPFTEWSGHYTNAEPEAAFRVKSVLHRDDPIILAQLPFVGPGVLTYGNHLLASAHLWNHLDQVVPGVKGVWFHLEFGGYHACAISIEQKYGGHAKQTALVALGHFNYLRKIVIVVDDDIDPTDLREVVFALGMRSSPDEWDVVRQCWTGTLDPLLSPKKREIGDITHSAVMILACKPYHWMKDFPPRLQIPSELVRQIDEKWGL